MESRANLFGITRFLVVTVGSLLMYPKALRASGEFATIVSSQGSQAGPADLHRHALELFSKGDVNGAVRDLEECVRLDPASAEAWNDLGVIFRKQGDPVRAVASFEQAVSARPSYSTAIYNLALAYEARNELGRATVRLQQVVSLAPAMPQGHGVLGRVLLKQGKPREASGESAKSARSGSRPARSTPPAWHRAARARFYYRRTTRTAESCSTGAGFG